MDWRDWDAQSTARARGVDFGSVYAAAAAARKRWLTGLPLAALILAGAVLCLQPARYGAEARLLSGPRLGGLTGLRPSVARPDGAGGIGDASGQARLITSRDLARRAIKDLGLEDKPEFDPAATGLGLCSRALVFLGIMRDPARQSPEDRVLEAFQERLRVSGPDREGLITIAFQSEDRGIAADAANRVAELYLDMRADASHAAPSRAGARIVARAIAPPYPVFPRQALLLLSGAAMFVMALAAIVSIAAPAGRAPIRPAKPFEQPRALGQVRVFTRFSNPSRFNPKPGPELGPQTGYGGHGGDGGNEQATAKIVARILSAPFDGAGARGTRIVAASLGSAAAASGMIRDIARDLAREGRSIVIGRAGSDLVGFGRLAARAGGEAGPPEPEPTLGDILSGTACFAEVIRRDPASRLHFLPVGRQDELNLPEFANALDALAETYDFIVTMAPPLDQNSIAATLAARADFAVLAIPAGPQGGSVFEAEARLIEAGAREVLLIGLPANAQQSLGRDAA